MLSLSHSSSCVAPRSTDRARRPAARARARRARPARGDARGRGRRRRRRRGRRRRGRRGRGRRRVRARARGARARGSARAGKRARARGEALASARARGSFRGCEARGPFSRPLSAIMCIAFSLVHMRISRAAPNPPLPLEYTAGSTRASATRSRCSRRPRRRCARSSRPRTRGRPRRAHNRARDSPIARDARWGGGSRPLGGLGAAWRRVATPRANAAWRRPRKNRRA